MTTTQCIDKLYVDTHSSCGTSGTPFKQIPHAEIACYPARIDRFFLICKSRVAGDDEQSSHPREVGNEIFGQPIGKMLLLRVSAHIHEGKHGNRRLVR